MLIIDTESNKGERFMPEGTLNDIKERLNAITADANRVAGTKWLVDIYNNPEVKSSQQFENEVIKVLKEVYESKKSGIENTPTNTSVLFQDVEQDLRLAANNLYTEVKAAKGDARESLTPFQKFVDNVKSAFGFGIEQDVAKKELTSTKFADKVMEERNKASTAGKQI